MNGDNDQPQHILESFSKKFFRIPWFTRNVLIFLVLTHIVIFACEFAIENIVSMVCFDLRKILSRFELWRLFTFQFVHASFLHILFNCLTWWRARVVEKSMGTFPLMFFVALCLTFGTLMMLTLSLVLSFTPFASLTGATACTVGWSGVLFGVMVLEMALIDQSHVRVFGMFPVPKNLYPWLLLVLFQIIIPNVSFLGHLVGILMGYLQKGKIFKRITPIFEQKEMNWNGFVTAGGSLLPFSGGNEAAGDFEDGFGSMIPQNWRRIVASYIPRMQQEVQPQQQQQQVQQGPGLNESLHVLMEMGFERNIAMNALARNGGNLEGAILTLSNI